MKLEFAPSHLDPRAFAQAAREVSGGDSLAGYERIAQECVGHGQNVAVAWSARGEMRYDHLGQEAVWLHLHADVNVPMTCQRCLEVVEVPLLVDRSFRFVADEETAAVQDDDAQEDLLVLVDNFSLRQLIEDELVLALPLIARHEVCPTQPPMGASDSEIGVSVAGRPNPFAMLAQFKPGNGNGRK